MDRELVDRRAAPQGRERAQSNRAADPLSTDWTERYAKSVRPEVGRLLKLFKLDARYVAGSGDLLTMDRGGELSHVHDFVGGFGSTILGHNPKVATDALSDALRDRAPAHVQVSVRGETIELAEELNELLKESFGQDKDYVLTLANSGAEAVEAALKHALLAWQKRREAMVIRLKSMRSLAASMPMYAEILEAQIAEVQGLGPVVWAMKGSFHGKTSAAVLATDNPMYRSMYPGQLFETRFLTETLDESAIRAEMDSCEWVLEIPGYDTLKLSRGIGFIFEPLQGEGGIRELPAEFLRAMRAELSARELPMIADEIQSGLWRTGEFLASRHSGVAPDYVLLGKSLGGSIAKIAGLMIARPHYVDEFGFLHTSTFAEDALSSRVALAVVQELSWSQESTRLRAKAFEQRVRALAAKIEAECPGVIRRVKGRGFMIGVEFDLSEDAPLPDMLFGLAEQGFAAYLFSSYLLNRHGLRVGVTLSAPDTLRLEPSREITGEALAALEAGLVELCRLIRDRKMGALAAHLFGPELPPEALRSVSPARPTRNPLDPSLPNVGFVCHMVDPKETRRMDPLFSFLPEKDIEQMFGGLETRVGPYRMHRQVIRGADGRAVNFHIISLMLPSTWFERQVRERRPEGLAIVQDAVNFAAGLGCEYMGLGQFTSIVTMNGMALDRPAGMKITTGNSLTAGMAIRAAERSLAEKGKTIAGSRVGIVGFTGNICNVIAQVFADQTKAMTLVHWEPLEASAKFQRALGRLTSIPGFDSSELRTTHRPEDLADCDLVVIGTNSTKSFIDMPHLKDDAVVLDLSVPSNVTEEVKKDPRKCYLVGGLTMFPDRCSIEHPWNFVPGTPYFFACMAETIAMGMHKVDESVSLGMLSKESVLKSLRLADEAGIRLGASRTF